MKLILDLLDEMGYKIVRKEGGINIKKQNNYTLLTDEIINSTNSQDGQKMCLYTDGKTLYVRENREFGEKFNFEESD
jgi:hypothetical protein